MRKLRIATRTSALALTQAEAVRALIANVLPKLDVELIGFTTTGDRSQRSDGALLTGKGDFLKELEEAIARNEADIAVHSMKDVPARLPETFTVATVGPRADPRDAYVCNQSMSDLGAGARIGTSSVRRAALVTHFYKKSKIIPIRGNVKTRLTKLDEGHCDALILAAAGLARLGLAGRVREYLDVETFVPAAGQGAIGVEYQSQNREIARLVEAISDKSVDRCVAAERAVVAGLDCDCSAPIGVHCVENATNFELSAIVLAPDGSALLRTQLRGPDPYHLSMQATQRFLELDARKLIAGK